MKNKSHIVLKTLRVKEKLLVKSNFSSSHSVFQSYISLVRQNAELCGIGLIVARVFSHLSQSRSKAGLCS